MDEQEEQEGKMSPEMKDLLQELFDTIKDGGLEKLQEALQKEESDGLILYGKRELEQTADELLARYFEAMQGHTLEDLTVMAKVCTITKDDPKTGYVGDMLIPNESADKPIAGQFFDSGRQYGLAGKMVVGMFNVGISIGARDIPQSLGETLFESINMHQDSERLTLAELAEKYLLAIAVSGTSYTRDLTGKALQISTSEDGVYHKTNKVINVNIANRYLETSFWSGFAAGMLEAANIEL